MEKLINNNAMKIEGLKKTVDFICSEVQDLKKTMSDAEKCIDEEKRQKLEGYHRRWNLKLYGVSEKADLGNKKVKKIWATRRKR